MSEPDKSFQKVYNRLIPVVIVFPVVFLIFFIVVSMIQLQEINSRIEEGQSTVVKEMYNKAMTGEQFSEGYHQFLTLAVLEEESLSERYRQGHYSLVSRSFKQFLGFFTGIIMVIVGSVFVLLKLKESMDLGVQQGESLKLSLITSSPGIAFGVVGAVLIGLASLSNDRIVVRDSGLYLTKEYLVAPYFSGSSREVHDKYMLNQGTEEEDELIEQYPPPKKENP